MILLPSGCMGYIARGLFLIKRVIAMDKFKIGDRITPKEAYRGFDNAVITGKDDKFYYLKIMNGKATIPLSAIECYKKV